MMLKYVYECRNLIFSSLVPDNTLHLFIHFFLHAHNVTVFSRKNEIALLSKMKRFYPAAAVYRRTGEN